MHSLMSTNEPYCKVLPSAFIKMVKSLLVIKFKFYKLMSTLHEIEWCCNNMLCSFINFIVFFYVMKV